MDAAKMSVKELKAYLRLHKKTHCVPFSKLKKPELVALAHSVHSKHGETHKEESHKKIETAKPVRKASPAQIAHREAFAKFAKAKKSGLAMSFADFKKDHLHPEMKASVVEKAEMKELTTALGEKTKAKPFVVEKELTAALSPEKPKKNHEAMAKMRAAKKAGLKIPTKEKDAILVKNEDELKNALVLMGMSEGAARISANKYFSLGGSGYLIWKTPKRINMKKKAVAESEELYKKTLEALSKSESAKKLAEDMAKGKFGKVK